MKKLNNSRGFTIVELLVVIVVIAILVALTLPNLFGLQRRARDDDRKNDIKNIKSALETYYSDKNVYPDQLSDLVPDYGFSAIPTDPQGGASYTYTPAPAGCTDACTSWTLTANLENDNDPQAVNGEFVETSVNQ